MSPEILRGTLRPRLGSLSLIDKGHQGRRWKREREEATWSELSWHGGQPHSGQATSGQGRELQRKSGTPRVGKGTKRKKKKKITTLQFKNSGHWLRSCNHLSKGRQQGFWDGKVHYLLTGITIPPTFQHGLKWMCFPDGWSSLTCRWSLPQLGDWPDQNGITFVVVVVTFLLHDKHCNGWLCVST